jgi:Leucine-rich repeat (LRR) protein
MASFAKLAILGVALVSLSARGGSLVDLCRRSGSLSSELQSTIAAIRASLTPGEDCAALGAHLDEPIVSIAADDVTLSPLAEFTELDTVFLEFRRLHDGFGAVRSKSQLTRLVLSCRDPQRCTVEDLPSLASLAGLKWLEVDQLTVPLDLRLLDQMQGLESLHLSRVATPHLGPLTGHDALRELTVSGSRLRDALPLHQMTALRGLALDANDLADVDWAMSLVNLRWLDLSGNRELTAIWAVRYMMNLESLDLAGANLTSIAPLQDLPWLAFVGLSDNTAVTDWDVLARLGKLTSLDVSGTNVPKALLTELAPELGVLKAARLGLDSLEFAANYARLGRLEVSRNQIPSLAPIAATRPLRILDASYNRLTELASLGLAPLLIDLDVTGNQIVDLGPVARLRIHGLRVGENPVTDVSPLTGHPTLERLDVSHTAVTDLSVVKTMPRLRQLVACGAPLVDKTCPRTDLVECRIDCP